MRVIKYFYEEPTFLHLGGESSEELDPAVPASLLKEQSHYRGYLAASDLDSGAIGGSSLEDDAAAHALTAILDSPAWYFSIESGQTTSGIQLLEDEVDIVRALVKMPSKSLLITGVEPAEESILSLTEDQDRRNNLATIFRLLEAGCTIVLPEPAHVGHDWSIYSANPMADRMREQFSKEIPNCRRYVIPYVQARGEHKFYFEQFDLTMFAHNEVLQALTKLG
jgi:hypothetical protein